jgi:hypothetical protein
LAAVQQRPTIPVQFTVSLVLPWCCQDIEFTALTTVAMTLDKHKIDGLPQSIAQKTLLKNIAQKTLLKLTAVFSKHC